MLTKVTDIKHMQLKMKIFISLGIFFLQRYHETGFQRALKAELQCFVAPMTETGERYLRRDS